jgi:hypothetical protein
MVANLHHGNEDNFEEEAKRTWIFNHNGYLIDASKMRKK